MLANYWAKIMTTINIFAPLTVGLICRTRYSTKMGNSQVSIYFIFNSKIIYSKKNKVKKHVLLLTVV